VRAATVTFRRLIETALSIGLLATEDLAGPTDEELLGMIEHRLDLDDVLIEWKHARPVEGGDGPLDATGRVRTLLEALTARRLPKRVVELFGDSLPQRVGAWTSDRDDLVHRVEERLATDWGLPAGSVFLDYPSNPGMMDLNLLLVRADGGIQRLTAHGARGLIDLPRLSTALNHSARVLRVFASAEVSPPEPGPLLALVESPPEEVERRLESDEPLLPR
jgi:hypothetical protein